MTNPRIASHQYHRIPCVVPHSATSLVFPQVCGLIKGGCSAVIGVGDNFYGAQLLPLKALTWTLKAWNGPLSEQNIPN